MLVGYRTDDPRVDFVDSDNISAVVQVADHFVALGHKKIACITGPLQNSRNAADRLAGFKKGLRKNGLGLPDEYVLDGDFRRDPGQDAMKKLLGLKERPTAVFCCNDLMALGAWDAIENEGLEVGRDVALVGFDDIAQASNAMYSLTTVRQKYRSMSMVAARMLIEKIQASEQWKPRQILVPTDLIVRHSCGAESGIGILTEQKSSLRN